jgi:hypothetical protein
LQAPRHTGGTRFATRQDAGNRCRNAASSTVPTRHGAASAAPFSFIIEHPREALPRFLVLAPCPVAAAHGCMRIAPKA